jgi:hypothetical protein
MRRKNNTKKRLRSEHEQLARRLAGAKEIDLRDEAQVAAWLRDQPMTIPLRGSSAPILKSAKIHRGGEDPGGERKRARRARDDYKPELFQ